MSDVPPVSAALTAAGIPHRLFRHQGPVSSLEQAAAERDQRPAQVVRSILFRVAEAEFVMVLMAGPRQIPWPALRRALDQNRLTLATQAEVWQVTGYEIGAVAPFGLPQPLRVLVDSSVLNEKEISLGSGERGVAVVMDSADLVRALESAEIVSLSA